MSETWLGPDGRASQRAYGLGMKKPNPIFILASAVAATVLTGCASMDRGYTDVAGARSALAFTSVTDAKELTKWTGDPFIQRSLRSIDTYYFQVPDTGFRPGSVDVTMRDNDRVIIHDNGRMNVDVDRDHARLNTSRPDVTYRDGMGASGSYQTQSGGYKTIEYRPGHSR
jgi:hypothetical protein